mgnify:CR=1 FL=1
MSKKKDTPVYNIQLNDGKLFKFEPNGKYLIVVSKDAEIKQLASALGEFMKPAKLFVLAVNQVSDIKITELLQNEN